MSQSGATRLHHSNYFTLVQSSGTGKSKAIDEYSKHHVAFPLCWRNDDETGAEFLLVTSFESSLMTTFIGFPNPDTAVRDFLLIKPNQAESLTRIYAFFFSLFQKAAKELYNIREGIAKETLEISISKITKELHRRMADQNARDKFYEDVCEEAKEVQTDLLC